MAKVVGGGVGGIGGLWYGVLTGEGKNNAPEKMVEARSAVLASCATFTGRRTHLGRRAETEFGRTLTELVDRAAEVICRSVQARGTLVSPDAGGAVSTGAWRARCGPPAGDAALGGGYAADEPTLHGTGRQGDRRRRADQLPSAERQQVHEDHRRNCRERPLAGGSRAPNAARPSTWRWPKQMDPETDITVLDDASFKQLQDAAGERIGEISSNTKCRRRTSVT